MKGFSLTNLTDVQFEEFCYDLLAAMGATRMSWRKGTGTDASPADQGRDIECFFERQDVDGNTVSERWFIDCKHYKRGVPPEKLHALLTWASTERADVALIVASEFLSNPAKNWIDTYRRENRPPFKIKVWERPDLEKLCIGKPLLMRKYGLEGEFEFLNILHPAHVRYLKHPPLNSLDYFFGVLDELEPGERKSFFLMSILCIINPQADEPTDAHRQSLGDLIRGKIDYVTFRQKCYSLAGYISPDIIVMAIVHRELSMRFVAGDITAIQEARQNMLDGIAFFEDELTKPKKDYATIRSCIKDLKARIPGIEEQIRKNYGVYCSFCEKVVVPLFKEPPRPLPTFLRKYSEKYDCEDPQPEAQ